MKTEDLRNTVILLVVLYESTEEAKAALKEATEKHAAILGIDKQILAKYVSDSYKGKTKKRAQTCLDYIDMYEGLNPGDPVIAPAGPSIKVVK